jgi:hypothetical protein
VSERMRRGKGRRGEKEGEGEGEGESGAMYVPLRYKEVPLITFTKQVL